MEEKTCKIYKIVDNTNGDIYIGSTAQTLKQRLSGHKSKCNYVNKCTSYQIINNGNYKIELIEDLGNVSKEERLQKERYYIENNECINKCIPGRTRQETQKAYDEKHKEQRKDYNKTYREKNSEYYKEKRKEYREKNKEYNNEKFICECGTNYSRCNKTRHEKSLKHKNYLNTIN